MLKSPLRYPGGKSRIAPQLVDFFAGSKVYIEPFVGGGSVFLEAIRSEKFESFIISDLNRSVSDFWEYGIHENQVVFDLATSWWTRFQTGRELHNFLISGHFEGPENAAKFFLLNRITFSGLTESGGFSQSCYNDRLTPSSLDRLRALAKLGKLDIQVFNEDYEALNYEDNATVYMDPPYASAEQHGLYGVDGSLHAGFNHARFFDFFDTLKSQAAATYDASEKISHLLKGRESIYVKEFFHDYSLSRSFGNSGKRGLELLISNFQIQELTNKAS